MKSIVVGAQYVAISELREFPNNPRRGDVELLVDSLTYHGQYRPIVENRRTVFDGMRDADIGVQVHYVPVHHHPISHDISQGASDLPVCESVYERIISLPIHPRLTDEDQDFVVKTLLSLQ